ncbi:hypothetical protein N7447_007249, partial [Penicillium robsamsonii]|uniref:uncharacterized protein n=1 Tax=Penicillium robsamsonii TaxID=1792511 RepID=UPI0025473792
MRVHLFSFAVLALLIVRIHAAASDRVLFPSCAITCDSKLFSNCSLNNDMSCFCASGSRPTALLNLVETSCTTKEFFTTKRVYEKECGITPHKGPSVVDAATLIPLILASFFFVVRIIAKSSGLAGGWGLDDYTIIISYVLGAAIYVLYIYAIRNGFGQNIWDIPFPTITRFYRYFQGLAVMYKVQISLAKISVCLFLLRIFRSQTFRCLAYTLIGINAAIGISWAFVDSFRCLPVHLTWTGWMNEEPAQCIDFISSILVNCLVNIFVDFVLIIMPVYEVTKLQLPLQKKVSVGLMFIVGSVLMIIAIIRVVVFWNNRWGSNQTFGLYPVTHWTVIESQIAVMCACLPASRAVAVQLFPQFLGGTRSRTTPTHTADDSNSKHTSGKIKKSVTYSVNYGSPSGTHSDVELLD